MNDPTTTTTPPIYPAATAESVTIARDHFRQRAIDLRAAADRADTTRYAERGGALDDATRAAGAARQEADAARQQAAREWSAARKFAVESDDRAAAGRQPGADARAEQYSSERNQALGRAAEQRAERLDRLAEESGARADELDARVAELQQAADDSSVATTIREAATKMDVAVDQYDEKIRLLSNAESLEKDAADLDSQGDSISADLYREQVAEVRGRADAIVPEVPSLDPRILRAADVPWADEGLGQPGMPGRPTPGGTDPDGNPLPPVDQGDPMPPEEVPQTGPSGGGQPVDPYASADSDRDGLSDDFERQLGTKIRSDDTDGDGWVDGIEVAIGALNPRVPEYTPLDPERAADQAQAIAEMEQARGRTVGDDSDGDGVNDWVESLGGFTKNPNLKADDIVHNLSPLDQFVKSASDQMGKPYRFGAAADPASKEGGAAYDSSELVEWAAKQAGVRDMPDGSWNQYRYLHEAGASVPVEEALQTKGALVFGFSSDPLASADRPARAYVGISMGNGKVLDVSERAGEVREMDPGTFYGYGAKIPQLHEPTGDLDGDDWTDQEEIDFGGDPTRGIRVQRPEGATIEVPVDGTSDPIDPAAPGTSPDAGTDPVGTDGYPTTSRVALTDDPTGASGYDDQSRYPESNGYDDPTGFDPTKFGYQGDEPEVDATKFGDPDPTGGYGYDDPSPGSSGEGTTPPPAAPVPAGGGDSYDDSYGDVDEGGSYDDSYGDLSTTYD